MNGFLIILSSLFGSIWSSEAILDKKTGQPRFKFKKCYAKCRKYRAIQRAAQI